MIVSAIALFRKLNTDTPLNVSAWGGTTEENGKRELCHVAYSGHAVKDGSVRIYAEFGKPSGSGKHPAVLLLPDAGKRLDRDLIRHFVDKGYAVLMPDYSGKMASDPDGSPRTVYPASLSYANFDVAKGLDDLGGANADETCWFEWLYVALYSIKYLKSREDISEIGVVGIRLGGELAWKTMLSPDVRCGVPINAVGWRSNRNFAKFESNAETNLSPDKHAYIAGIESQSYAPFVQCPVLMLCALHDHGFDADRAYDTYARIGQKDGNAIVYCGDSGSCIGPFGIADMDLFLERNLKGRQIFIPDSLTVNLNEEEDGTLVVDVEGDKEGLVSEVSVYYAESDSRTKSSYREWQCVLKTDGKGDNAEVDGGKIRCRITPYSGASTVYVFAAARYLNGFKITSRITAKKRQAVDVRAVKNRMLYGGEGLDGFNVADYEEYSVGKIFLEREALPKLKIGYDGIVGAYSVGGIKTYKISSPQYVPAENALLKFDVYFYTDGELAVSVNTADIDRGQERYTCVVPVKGGGKWKRIVLKANDFKNEENNMPLSAFSEGKALLFVSEDEDMEYAITNILWL
jgi:dienelactone hydrolase